MNTLKNFSSATIKMLLVGGLLFMPYVVGAVAFPSPLGAVTPQQIIGRVIRAALGLTGSLAFIMFIYGGFLWMTAGGNEQKIEKGRNILVWTTLGLVVIFGAYAAVDFVLKQF